MSDHFGPVAIGAALCAAGFFALAVFSSDTAVREADERPNFGPESAQHDSTAPGRSARPGESFSYRPGSGKLFPRDPSRQGVGGSFAEGHDARPVEKDGVQRKGTDRSALLVGRSAGQAEGTGEVEGGIVRRLADSGEDVARQRREERIALLDRNRDERHDPNGGTLAGRDEHQSETGTDVASLAEPLDEKEGLLLSVPLDGSTTAEGATQPEMVANVGVDAEGGRVDFRDDSMLAFPNADSLVRPESGTISLDIEPYWDVNASGDNSLFLIGTADSPDGHMWLRRRGQYMRFEWLNEDGELQGASVGIRDWKPGDRHVVTTAWDDQALTIYIDGKSVRTLPRDSAKFALPTNSSVFLGSYQGENVNGADATLRDFKVYDRPLSAAEIAALKPPPTPAAPAAAPTTPSS